MFISSWRLFHKFTEIFMMINPNDRISSFDYFMSINRTRILYIYLLFSYCTIHTIFSIDNGQFGSHKLSELDELYVTGELSVIEFRLQKLALQFFQFFHI